MEQSEWLQNEKRRTEYWNFVTVRKDWNCWNRECGKDIKKGERCWSLTVNTWNNNSNLTIRYCRDCGDPRKEDSASYLPHLPYPPIPALPASGGETAKKLDEIEK